MIKDQQKMAKVGLEMKLLTSEVDAEAEKWDEYAENDIVKRAKAMSSMAYNMYLFTRGDGPLKTTHDLFTQAEFFAEQANKMYKTVREFSYEVPGSAEKSELSTILERIPVHCQQLQVLVKSPTVGKSATFGKVDSVIQETKNLMNEIAKLVTSSFVCATKAFQNCYQVNRTKSNFAVGLRHVQSVMEVVKRALRESRRFGDELRVLDEQHHRLLSITSTRSLPDAAKKLKAAKKDEKNPVIYLFLYQTCILGKGGQRESRASSPYIITNVFVIIFDNSVLE
ncbi:hypothetical protein DICVIV_08662 [Dictyocaulus viviparus]|uniref:Alpha-catulin n=1 Tax=Dictyocaulus viviparus TaxID=29172 RepID=A0A0D8XSE1_DICVI|nr:hypothetical protein DICVIV_08662 [Dictyocaulus viviparus]